MRAEKWGGGGAQVAVDGLLFDGTPNDACDSEEEDVDDLAGR